MHNSYTDGFPVRMLHLEDRYLDALHKHHSDRRFDTIYAGAPQRRGVAPMHAGHPRRDRAMFQREED